MSIHLGSYSYSKLKSSLYFRLLRTLQSVAHDGMLQEREEEAMLLNSYLSLLYSGRLSLKWRAATEYGREVCVSLDVGKEKQVS